MMKQKCSMGSRSVMGHGIFMLSLGMVLCSLGSWMSSLKGNALGYALAVVVTATGLLIPGVLLSAEGLQKRLGIRPGKFYFLTALVSLACGGILWVVPSSYDLDTRVLTLLAGGVGVFWGLWFVRLAFHVQRHPGKAGVLCILGGGITFLGILIALQPDLSSLTAVTTVACYLLWIGAQILLVVPLLFRDWISPAHAEAKIQRVDYSIQ